MDAAWDTVAEAYARQAARAFHAGRAVSEWLVEAAGAGPGTTILDVAAGPGSTSFLAAERGAAVICSDQAGAMVAIAEREAAERALAGIAFRVLDAMDLDLDDASVDGVICRYAIMLMPDPGRAVAEARRVLRAGGALAYAVWAGEDVNPWATVIRRGALAAGFEPPQPPGRGGMFDLADPGENERLARAAGFGEVETASIHLPMVFGSFDEFWSLRLEASLSTRELIGSLTPDEGARVRASTEELSAPFGAGDGTLTFPTTTLLVRAA